MAFKSSPEPSESVGKSLGASKLAEGIMLAVAGQVEKACACFEEVLLLDSYNLKACYNLGAMRLSTGDMAAAVAMFDRALAIDPHDEEIRTLRSKALTSLAGKRPLEEIQLHSHSRKEVRDCRNELAIHPGNKIAKAKLMDALALSKMPAEQGDFMADADTALGNHALIACMQKSGSSLLFEMIHHLTGWEKAFFSSAYFQNEQELDLPSILEVVKTDTVTQQHCRATEANIHIMQGLSIRPVVLVRNLADVVMSLVDYYDHGALINTFLDAEWFNLSPASKCDYIIDHVMPWYVGFYTSWRRVEAASRLDCLFVHYEEMIADKPGTLRKVANFLGLEKSIDAYDAAIAAAEGDKAKTRFNKGIVGRGAASLDNAQQARLKQLTTPFPSIDFSPIGL
ncbi:MAG: sulfotransferase domain-containing protein [Alphaproteobacteria bacterium]